MDEQRKQQIAQALRKVMASNQNQRVGLSDQRSNLGAKKETFIKPR